MYHRILFRGDYELDFQVLGKARLEKVVMRDGEVVEAKVRPRVQESKDGPVEVADLQLGGGTLLGVRMECFRFFEDDEDDETT